MQHITFRLISTSRQKSKQRKRSDGEGSFNVSRRFPDRLESDESRKSRRYSLSRKSHKYDRSSRSFSRDSRHKRNSNDIKNAKRKLLQRDCDSFNDSRRLPDRSESSDEQRKSRKYSLSRRRDYKYDRSSFSRRSSSRDSRHKRRKLEISKVQSGDAEEMQQWSNKKISDEVESLLEVESYLEREERQKNKLNGSKKQNSRGIEHHEKRKRMESDWKISDLTVEKGRKRTYQSNFGRDHQKHDIPYKGGFYRRS